MITAPTIFLIGFMGAGKTTLGKALAGCHPELFTYADLDELAEIRAGMSVSDIFNSHGERYFRQLETQLLHETALPGAIVGCGGGTPCHSGNIDWMNSHGLTVLLQVSREVLLRRLLEAQPQRPLISGMTPLQVAEYIVHKQEERMQWYERAQLRFSSDHLETTDEIAASCREFFDTIINPNIVNNATD